MITITLSEKKFGLIKKAIRYHIDMYDWVENNAEAGKLKKLLDEIENNHKHIGGEIA